jgi:hypothetical protein
VTYGSASAPYLSTRCLQQLAEDESTGFSLELEMLTNIFYVDDALCGANTTEDALILQQELIANTTARTHRAFGKRGVSPTQVLCQSPQQIRSSPS